MASKATEMSAPCLAQRCPAPPSALRRADPTRPLCVQVLDSTGLYFKDKAWILRNDCKMMHEARAMATPTPFPKAKARAVQKRLPFWTQQRPDKQARRRTRWRSLPLCRSYRVPGHALHKKGLPRRNNVVPLVGSQEQRALFGPLINW